MSIAYRGFRALLERCLIWKDLASHDQFEAKRSPARVSHYTERMNTE